MNKIDSTQSFNWLSIAGLIVLVLDKLGVSISEGDIQAIISAIITIVGVVGSFVANKKAKNLTLGGARKYPLEPSQEQ